MVCSSVAFAQQQLFGRIIKKAGTEVLIGVNISNLSQKKYNVSDMGGNYRIPASPGDTIIFSSAGYQPDTLVVDLPMLADSHPVILAPHFVQLPYMTVDEMRNYELDSMQRREDYRNVYEKKHPVRLWNEKRPMDGPGFSFSPVGYLSTGEKRKRRLKKRLQEEDEGEYIDYKFSRSRVAMLTNLKGDSLQLFMLRYRPSYTFCRNANNQDMFLYINDKLKLFRKGKVSRKRN